MQKRFAKVVLVFASILFLTGCGSNIQNIDVPDDQIMSLEKLRNDDNATLKAMVAEVNKSKTAVFKVVKGEKIPLELVFDTAYLELIPGDNYFVAKQDFYLYISDKQGLLLSPDGKAWAALNDADGVKQLFHMKGVKFHMDFNMNEEGAKTFMGVKEEPEESK